MSPSKKLKTSDPERVKQDSTVSDTEPNSKQDSRDDWRARCSSICHINSYALKKSILTDVTFVVGEESVECHAHRLILALGSPVFEAMFYGALAEKGESITIPDVDPEAFRNLLSFLYTDAVNFQNDVTAFKTYFAADKYCVTHLKELCEEYLRSCTLTPSNVWIFLESSMFLNSQSIKNRCFSFLRISIEAALQHKSFLDVNAKTIETLLCLDSLNISEMELLQNVIRWAENKSSEEQGNSFQSILMPLLKFIRFGILTAPQFISFLDNQKLKDLLTDQDALHILKHIIQPVSCALPNWCCTKTWRNHVPERGSKHSGGLYYSDKPKTVHKDKKESKSISKTHFIPTYSPTTSFSSSSSSTSSSDASEHTSDSDSSD